jgi:DNA-directed RNA polymerase subunit N (RpoN/RPB10)
MLLPPRCWSCGALIGNKWAPYQQLLKEGMSECEALDGLHLKRYCCRRMLLTHVELVEKLLCYSVKPDRRS